MPCSAIPDSSWHPKPILPLVPIFPLFPSFPSFPSFPPFPTEPTMTQPHSHIVKSHDEERNRVISEILRMGSMAAAQLEAALDVPERRDDKAAARIIGNDEELNKPPPEQTHA